MSIAESSLKSAFRQERKMLGPAHPNYGETMKAFARRTAVKNHTKHGAYTARHWAAVWLDRKNGKKS